MNANPLSLFLCTAAALIAFAGNSILCRYALGEQSIDAASFTGVRLLSGMGALWLMIWVRKTVKGASGTHFSDMHVSTLKNESLSVFPVRLSEWWPAVNLFIYAAAFSYAYVSLDTGVGALILFTSVQLTMVVVSLIKGYRLQFTEWIGLAIAFSGFVYLVLPELTTPSLTGFILMFFSGTAWGFYTLAGRTSVDALKYTALNFQRTLPFILMLFGSMFGLGYWNQIELSVEGILFAVISGSLASGAGYAIWYGVLQHITSMAAAVLQLLVPVLATLGGIVFSGETLTFRLVVASMLILGGILLVVLSKRSSPAE